VLKCPSPSRGSPSGSTAHAGGGRRLGLCGICSLVPRIEPIGTKPGCQYRMPRVTQLVEQSQLAINTMCRTVRHGARIVSALGLRCNGPARRSEGGAERERERMTPGVHTVPPPADASEPAPGRWTRADLDRLIAGDKPEWDRVVAIIEGLSRRWNLSTIDADAVRDHVEDVLLADDMRLLRGFRAPGAFAAYLAKVTASRAGYVAENRPKAETRPLDGITNEALRRVADARWQAEFSPLKDGLTKYRTALGRAMLGLRHALTDRQFIVLWLYYVEGQATARIAGALNITARAVRKRHHTAIRTIEVRDPPS